MSTQPRHLEPRNQDLARIERWCGLAAGVLGVLLPLYSLLFSPPANRVGHGSGSILLVLFPIVTVVALAAFADSLTNRSLLEYLALPVLWVSALSLWVIVVAPYPTIDGWVLPAAVLGLIAAVAGTWSELQANHVV